NDLPAVVGFTHRGLLRHWDMSTQSIRPGPRSGGPAPIASILHAQLTTGYALVPECVTAQRHFKYAFLCDSLRPAVTMISNALARHCPGGLHGPRKPQERERSPGSSTHLAW